MSVFADNFIMMNSKNLPADKIQYVYERLAALPEERQMWVNSVSFQDPTIILILSIVGGSLGIDRFMLGQVGLGVGKLLTAGGCGIWSIVDWFLIMNVTRQANFEKLMQVL